MEELPTTESPVAQFPSGRRILTTLLTVTLLIVATTAAVLYGMGYRLGFSEAGPKISHTGILNASSSPRGAQVFVDGHLTTATNNTVNLIPGKYTVRMTKEGYQDWIKDFIIKEQLVTNADSLLLPSAPTLQSISTVGISNPVLDPTQSKLAFTVASQSAATKNGIYVLDMSARSFPVLPIQTSALQIVSDTPDTLFSQAQLSWTPDGQQIIASISANATTPTTYLLQTNQLNSIPSDITATLPSLQEVWQSQLADKDKLRLQAQKTQVRNLIQKYMNVLSWSPDDTKILYSAKDDGNLPVIIQPRRIGNNTLYEVRQLKTESIYVYNITEDINTKILDSSPLNCDPSAPDCHIPLQWFPDSGHLIYVNEHKINIVEDDGANMTTVYAGPFDDRYVFPWPDGTKLVIITNLNNTNIPPTFYTISLQ